MMFIVLQSYTFLVALEYYFLIYITSSVKVE